MSRRASVCLCVPVRRALIIADCWLLVLPVLRLPWRSTSTAWTLMVLVRAHDGVGSRTHRASKLLYPPAALRTTVCLCVPSRGPHPESRVRFSA
ncbi:hypothetical protein BO71DRAFT_225605 [Aspergillus ellipticus CBS 707.79]|uniref:Uncharacterized protein n=1 Tax=Aspergillus ellipticus CBS 707.79 TaxID=1448320 RepID=A0A319DBS9_9EURO|nr:hypothetical protein BO71DRAFT_225605 [Aspergillus ellipticus CBS 707.79]